MTLKEPPFVPVPILFIFLVVRPQYSVARGSAVVRRITGRSVTVPLLRRMGKNDAPRVQIARFED